eukprot:2619179-Rhodomonas_salina.1
MEHSCGVAGEGCAGQQALERGAPSLDVGVLGFLRVEQDLELPRLALPPRRMMMVLYLELGLAA